MTKETRTARWAEGTKGNGKGGTEPDGRNNHKSRCCLMFKSWLVLTWYYGKQLCKSKQELFPSIMSLPRIHKQGNWKTDHNVLSWFLLFYEMEPCNLLGRMGWTWFRVMIQTPWAPSHSLRSWSFCKVYKWFSGGQNPSIGLVTIFNG